MKSILLFVALIVCAPSVFASGVEPYGSDYPTKSFWNIDKTFTLRFDTDHLRDAGVACNKTGATKYFAGKDSIFKEVDSDDPNKTIEFVFVTQKTDTSKNKTVPITAVINKPFRLCVSDDVVPDYSFFRVGGMDTGILVVPFKLRDGDIFSDSTIGPYIAFSGRYLSILATAGLTQVTVSDVNNTDDVKTETGVSIALGTVWSITSEFDLSLIVGIDHLSGSAGDDFEYQDKPWVSFGIGFNFTQ